MSACVKVNASKSYEVIIGEGLLAGCGEKIRAVNGGSLACIVADDTVDALYSDTVAASLSANGYKTEKFVIKHGEASKNSDNMLSLVRFLAEKGFSGNDPIAALGGGVVGDLAGLAASLYRRGVPFVQLPTTLLAAVDSSVGGKTAVDLPEGKNLLGAFYQPDIVVCDTACLGTLPAETFSDGCAEVIKYGMISDAALFEALFSAQMPYEGIIARCVSIKRDVVEQDERDTGLRRILNFGHTVGHAIELLSGYKISHGSAVAAGMAVVCRASVKRGVCGADSLRLEKLLERFNLPTGTDYSAAELADAMLSDKKRMGEHIYLIVPERVGRCVPMKMNVSQLEAFTAEGL